MPATIQTRVGTSASVTHTWATQTNAQIATVLREFALAPDGLAMDVETSDSDILNAVNELAGRRIYNYIVNWYRNHKKAESNTAIESENPLLT